MMKTTCQFIIAGDESMFMSIVGSLSELSAFGEPRLAGTVARRPSSAFAPRHEMSASESREDRLCTSGPVTRRWKSWLWRSSLRSSEFAPAIRAAEPARKNEGTALLLGQ